MKRIVAVVETSGSRVVWSKLVLGTYSGSCHVALAMIMSAALVGGRCLRLLQLATTWTSSRQPEVLEEGGDVQEEVGVGVLVGSKVSLGEFDPMSFELDASIAPREAQNVAAAPAAPELIARRNRRHVEELEVSSLVSIVCQVTVLSLR